MQSWLGTKLGLSSLCSQHLGHGAVPRAFNSCRRTWGAGSWAKALYWDGGCLPEGLSHCTARQRCPSSLILLDLFWRSLSRIQGSERYRDEIGLSKTTIIYKWHNLYKINQTLRVRIYTLCSFLFPPSKRTQTKYCNNFYYLTGSGVRARPTRPHAGWTCGINQGHLSSLGSKLIFL